MGKPVCGSVPGVDNREMCTFSGGKTDLLSSLNIADDDKPAAACAAQGTPETASYDIAGEHDTSTTTHYQCGDTAVDLLKTTVNGHSLGTSVAFDVAAGHVPSAGDAQLTRGGALTIATLKPKSGIAEK